MKNLLQDAAEERILRAMNGIGGIEIRRAVAHELAKQNFDSLNNFADRLGQSIACHSDYHGDSIMSAIYVAAEQRPIKQVTPLGLMNLKKQIAKEILQNLINMAKEQAKPPVQGPVNWVKNIHEEAKKYGVEIEE